MPKDSHVSKIYFALHDNHSVLDWTNIIRILSSRNVRKLSSPLYIQGHPDRN
jgi:hypothetical protein